MKVLKDNYSMFKEENSIEANPYPRKIVCEGCGSELEYEKADTRIGALGCVFIDCPLCGRDIIIDDDENSIELTVDNIEFPTHFFQISTENGAKNCCNNDEIKKCIHNGIEYFRKNKDEFNWYTCYGNLYISINRYSGDQNYWVVVNDNYYDTYIPFEKEDFDENTVEEDDEDWLSGV